MIFKKKIEKIIEKRKINYEIIYLIFKNNIIDFIDFINQFNLFLLYLIK